MGVVRGCGTRVAGGIYGESRLSDYGHEIEEFLSDLPKQVRYLDMGLSPVGVHAITDERTGVTNLYDIVGREHYPNVADFVEEARAHGISRRLPISLPWDRLSAASRLVILHSRAVIQNADDYFAVEPTKGEAPCPVYVSLLHCSRRGEAHAKAGERIPTTPACARFWWQDVVEPNRLTSGGRITRTVGDTTYTARERACGINPRYAMGVVGIFPLTQIAVIRDRESGAHRKALQRLTGTFTGPPIFLEDE